MAQGCWSVVSVCATSYSWTTGPHRGAMESPQTAAGTRDPATPMVAVQAENGSTNLAGIRSPGIGPDGRLVQMSAKIPLRGCEPLGFRRWVANFKDCASKAKLNGLLQNRAVPTREAVMLSFPNQSDGEGDDKGHSGGWHVNHIIETMHKFRSFEPLIVIGYCVILELIVALAVADERVEHL